MLDLILVRLAAQRALTTHVTADLRAVCIKEENQDVIVVFFCGDVLSDELEDSAQVATTEIISTMPDGENHYSRLIETRFIRGDYPKPMALFDQLVYLRYEPGCEVYREKLAKEVFMEVDLVTLRLAGERALLGRVTANLRRATIYEKEKAIFLHFWYDKEISELEHRLAKETTREVAAIFQPSPIKLFDFKVEQISYPKRVPKSFTDIFARYEPSLPEDFIPGW